MCQTSDSVQNDSLLNQNVIVKGCVHVFAKLVIVIIIGHQHDC